MKAMVVTDYGGPEVLEAREVEDPRPGPRDLLVEVHATSMNPVDFKVRQGGLGMDRQFPFILGYDVSGVVRGMGDEVQGFSVGDEVYGFPALTRDGANAELLTIDERLVAPKPASLDHRTAATLPLVTLTAWEALFKHARLHHGETVLIHGGGGGVAHIAIQLAKDHGAKVIATAGREASIELCKRCGADTVINYREEDLVARVKQITGQQGCPVVFETVGGENLKRSIACVSVHGRLVSILGAPQDAPVSDLFIKNASLHFEFLGAASMFGVGMEAQGETLRTVTEYVEAGKLSPHVSQTYPLDDLAEAHRQQETGHTLGKLAIAVR